MFYKGILLWYKNKTQDNQTGGKHDNRKTGFTGINRRVWTT